MQIARRRFTLFRLSPSVMAVLMLSLTTACLSGPGKDQLAPRENGNWAPDVAIGKQAATGVEIGHRLMAAGQFELAIDAFNRAAIHDGLTPEILSGLGSANLGLGRLGQAEALLRRALKSAPAWPAALNNLGIVLLEQRRYAEAEQILRRAYALDNGESDAIRENLRLALANMANSAHSDPELNEYKLVREGGGLIRIQKTP